MARIRKPEIIQEIIRRFRVTKKECEEIRDWINGYLQDHWRDDDAPEIEFKMRRSWLEHGAA